MPTQKQPSAELSRVFMASTISPDITTVHIVERMAPGGIETLVLDMVAAAPGAHYIVSLQGTEDELIAAWPLLEQHRKRLVAFGRTGGIDLKLVAKLRAFLRKVGADTVIAHHIGPLLYGGLGARLAGVKKVVHVEHDAWHYESSRRRRLGRALFALVRPDRVAVSGEIAQRIKLWDSAAVICVIPPGIDMRRFAVSDRSLARQRLGLAAQQVVIGTTGRLVPVKGQAYLIEALVLINRKRSAAQKTAATLVIVGDGPERANLEQTAVAAGVRASVQFLGHRDDLPDILPAFDVFCLPSLNEGLPRSVLEAQATGIPVVASDVGDLKSAVCPKSGRLVRPKDISGLADAICSVLDTTLSDESPQSLAIPRAFVEDRFSLSATMAAYARLTHLQMAT